MSQEKKKVIGVWPMENQFLDNISIMKGPTTGFGVAFSDGTMEWYADFVLANLLAGDKQPEPVEPKRDLTFAEAFAAVLKGKRISRYTGEWDNVFIYMNKGSVNKDLHSTLAEHIDDVPIDLFENGDRGTSTRLPNINMRTDRGHTLTGWTPTQIDMCAEDWFILED